MKKKILAPSPRQPLNGQGVLRISGLKLFSQKVAKRLGVRFGSWNVGSISGRGTEVCEELRKRKVDECCLQEVRWRGEGARFIGVKQRRYKLWWCENDDKTNDVGILTKEELCENVVEVRRRCDSVMAIALVFTEEVVRVICAYAPQSGKPDSEKERFHEEMACEWSMANANDVVLGLGDFNGQVGKCAEGFEGIQEGYGIGKEMLRKNVTTFLHSKRVVCCKYVVQQERRKEGDLQFRWK